MMNADRDAVICDMAQYYGVYDLKALSLVTAATLALGLPDDSRIKRKLSGTTAQTETLLLAAILDRLTTLVWFQTRDGQKGHNRPKSMLEALQGRKKKDESDDLMVFESSEALMAELKRIQEAE